MGKAPTDLSPKFWSSNKPKTLPKTGFGKALKDYEAAKKALEAKWDLKVADVTALIKTLDKLEPVRAFAQSKCLPKIHDDGDAMLEKYKSLIAKEAAELNKMQTAISSAVKVIQKSHAEMSKLKDKIEAREKSQSNIEALLKEVLKQKDYAKSKALMKIIENAEKEVGEWRSGLRTNFEKMVDDLSKLYPANKIANINGYAHAQNLTVAGVAAEKMTKDYKKWQGALQTLESGRPKEKDAAKSS